MPTNNIFHGIGATGAVGAYGPQGATGPTGSYAGSVGASGPFMFTDSTQNNSLSFHNSDRMVLRITNDGRVEWYGKPSEAASVLERTIGHMIDSKVASSGMRQRTYVRACQSLLNRAKQMTKDEFVAYLEESISNRQSKVVLSALEELSKLEESEG